MLPIRLETRRFTGGYEFGLADAPDVAVADPLQSEPLIVEAPNLENTLFMRFVNCETDADRLRFLDRFGDQSVWSMDELRAKADAIDAYSMRALSAAFPSPPGPDAVNAALAHVQIQPAMRRIDGASRLVLTVASTFDFMALEVAAAQEVGARRAACRHCRKGFLFGPQTGRRSHGKYCSDRCRAAATRARNAQGGDQ